MNEARFGAYCRAKGLYSEQIAAWREACLRANTMMSQLLGYDGCCNDGVASTFRGTRIQNLFSEAVTDLHGA